MRSAGVQVPNTELLGVARKRKKQAALKTMFMRRAVALGATTLFANPSGTAAQITNPVTVSHPAACGWDLSGDGLVATNDLLFLLAVYGRQAADDANAAAADGNGDGIVSTVDLLGLLAVFGQTCSVGVPPPPPPPITPQAAASEFAAALSAAATDPAAPLIAIASEITFPGDVSMVAVGTAARAEFEAGFSVAMAASLGDGATVAADAVIVDGIIGGSMIVLFHLEVPASLSFAGSSLLQTLVDSGATITVQSQTGTFAADTSTMTAPVVTPAAVDCIGSWAPDGACSAPCGPLGNVASTFTVTRTAQNGGADCTAADGSASTQICNTHIQCPVDCDGIWNPWPGCPVPCGGGVETRTYSILLEPQHGGACPDRDANETRACNTQACVQPIDCVGAYGALGACSESCGPNGVATRTFAITTVATNGGSDCTVSAGNVETQSCNTAISCPVDCVGALDAWSACSLPCGGGTQTRNFVVSAPALHGGLCPADGTSESQACNTAVCPPPPPTPVDCVGDYGAFGTCTETCGPSGVQTRSFVVTTPASNGGAACAAAAGDVDTQSCNTATACPVDCSGAMDAWGACSAACGGGTQSRSYVVSVPAANGGTCPGDGTSETQACNTDSCLPPSGPVDCVGGWGAFSQCSHPCAPAGLQQRTFNVATPVANGGAPW